MISPRGMAGKMREKHRGQRGGKDAERQAGRSASRYGNGAEGAQAAIHTANHRSTATFTCVTARAKATGPMGRAMRWTRSSRHPLSHRHRKPRRRRGGNCAQARRIPAASTAHATPWI